jgi:hypothetical protein
MAADGTNAGKPLIELDTEGFSPMKICGVRHSLATHPLLQLDRLVELADRLAAINAIRYHSGSVAAGTSFEKAPVLHRIDAAPEQIIRNIENSNAWLSLHNVQWDPSYRELCSAVLESVRPEVERRDPGMHRYAGWIFVSSPGAVTPYHMDFEHNFILQIRGKKEIHVFNPLARSVVTEECLELFHAKGLRQLVTYEPTHEAHATVFHAEPGTGAYMPTTAPHWVKNGDNVSVTMSFTFYTRETTRRSLLHRTNFKLRRLGIKPRPVGKNVPLDDIKLGLVRAAQAAKRTLRGESPPVREAFAPAAVKNSNL